ncbi:MAG TPA: T9SS type A sorting domain-containing protein, partial [Flavisolibacter sp.]|nr:T9SS type A sorting domain-containing protein [Flavisolibacter sp.]
EESFSETASATRNILNGNAHPDALTLAAYPNPSQGDVTLVTTGGSAGLLLTIRNMQGGIAAQKSVSPGSKTVGHRFQLPPGIYWAEASASGARSTLKIIVIPR